MSKHTPGPWVVDEANTNLVARLVNGVYEYVCEVEPSSFSTRECSQDQEEADARLIAAAPDLLEALKDMHSGWKYIRETHGDLYGVGWDRSQGKAEAAIAKAEGK
jgi:hypothetical protein